MSFWKVSERDLDGSTLQYCRIEIPTQMHWKYQSANLQSYKIAYTSDGSGGSADLQRFTNNGNALFGDSSNDHLSAEYAVRSEGRGRIVDEWKGRPERAENYLPDCIVGCTVGASIEGASLMGEKASGRDLRTFKLPTVSFSAMQKAKRMGGPLG